MVFDLQLNVIFILGEYAHLITIYLYRMFYMHKFNINYLIIVYIR